MSIKLTTTQKWLLLALGFIIINVALWLYGLSPTMNKLAIAREDLERTLDRRDKLQIDLDRLQAIDADALYERLAEMSPLLPEDGELREFIHYFVDLCDRLGIPFEEITISPSTEVGPYFLVTLTVGMPGKYENFKKLLITLEENERFILVRGLTLKGSDKGLLGTVSFSLFAENYKPLSPVKAPGGNNPFTN